MSIRVALIVSAQVELTLTAGREELIPSSPPPPDPETPFVNVGHADGDEVHITGPKVDDPVQLASSLEIRWYLPDQEDEDEARKIDVSETRLLVNITGLPPAEQGWKRRYRLESRKPCRMVFFYDHGFLPPFKATEITLNFEHLLNYGFDGYILSGVLLGHRPPSYQEIDWSFPTIEKEGYID